MPDALYYDNYDIIILSGSVDGKVDPGGEI